MCLSFICGLVSSGLVAAVVVSLHCPSFKLPFGRLKYIAVFLLMLACEWGKHTHTHTHTHTWTHATHETKPVAAHHTCSQTYAQTPQEHKLMHTHTYTRTHCKLRQTQRQRQTGRQTDRQTHTHTHTHTHVHCKTILDSGPGAETPFSSCDVKTIFGNVPCTYGNTWIPAQGKSRAKDVFVHCYTCIQSIQKIL